MISTSSSLVRRVVDAYGGERRWRSATTTEINLDAGGVIFNWKRGGGVRRVNFRLDIARPRARIWPLDDRGTVGILDGHDVRLETPDGEVLESRHNARQYFPGGRRLFHWDLLDCVYFVGYANWNYVNLPAHLLRDDIMWRQVDENMLEAQFPAHLPTHSAWQRFYFDPDTKLLRRHDFNVNIISPIATASQVIVDWGDWNGVPYPAMRRFRSRAGKKPHSSLYGPFMVWVNIHSFNMS